jgi:alkylated DNA repair dioxygenase AlkB
VNAQLEQNNFLYVPNFISQERAQDLNFWLLNERDAGRLIDDPRSNYGLFGKTYQDAAPFLELLCEKTNEISDLVKELVLPTYSFCIVYSPNSQLIRHLDRPACEISLTVHLGGDEEWPIFIKKPSGEEVPFKLNPGDAVIYLGCAAEHWREKFTGKYYSQVFLHYVRSRGPNAWAYFDKKQ